MIRNSSSAVPYIAPKKKLCRRILEDYQLYLLILPAVVAVFIFSYIPMYGAQIAFRNFSMRKGIWDSDWVGLGHFVRFLTSRNFPILFRNTLLISIYSLLWGFPVPILLAFMLNEVRNIVFKKTVQMITYIPYFISMVAMCSMIILFTDIDKGLINAVLRNMGMEPVAFLTTPAYFRTIYISTGIWQGTGWGTIIYLSALSGVDSQVLEAATIDGASRMQKLIYVNFPTILPTIIIILILNMGSIVSVGYEKIYLLQNALNMEVSDVIATFVYRLGIKDAQYSYTTAIGIFNSIVNIILLLTFNALCRKISETSLF